MPRVSPDGDRIAVAAPNLRGVFIHDLKTGELVHSLPDDPGSVWWLAWHPAGDRLAIARSNGHISIWNLSTQLNTNDDGSWYGYEILSAGKLDPLNNEADAMTYMQARDFHGMVAEGSVIEAGDED